jgi:hypothetical protein
VHISTTNLCTEKVTVKSPRYRPGVAQRVGSGIALLFHDHSTRRGWVVSITPRSYFAPGKDPVPIVQEAGWAPGSVWTGAENLSPTGIRSSDRPARNQSLYRLSYGAHAYAYTTQKYAKYIRSQNSQNWGVCISKINSARSLTNCPQWNRSVSLQTVVHFHSTVNGQNRFVHLTNRRTVLNQKYRVQKSNTQKLRWNLHNAYTCASRATNHKMFWSALRDFEVFINAKTRLNMVALN